MHLFYVINLYLLIRTTIVQSQPPNKFSTLGPPNGDLNGPHYSTPNEECTPIDGLCLYPSDVPNYEAIRMLHAHLDDDHSGDIDISESVDFLRDELNYTKGLEKRQEAFHPNNDHNISVRELWHMWISSEVYNWTVETTVNWLCISVELGQYADVFYENAINGSMLPRLATNNEQFLSRILGIKSGPHRSKIAIKAMDVVLFGPPKDTAGYLKDITIACLFIILLAGVTRFYHVQQNFEKQRVQMLREMNVLHEEEQKFQLELQKLREAPQAKVQKQEDQKTEEENNFGDNFSLNQGSEWDSASGNQTFNEPLDMDASSRNLLQLWLQLTYERERVAFEEKCRKMEQQLETAKEMCEKLNSTKKQLFGALVVVHGKIESKYQAITQARESFNEITMMHKEKEQRWSNIESLLDFDIIENPGITHLEFLLQPDLHQVSTQTTAVQQLLKSQSALIFLTMGGYSGISSGASESGRVSSSSPMQSYKGSSLDLKAKKRAINPLPLTDNAHDLISLKSSVSSREFKNSAKHKQQPFKHSRTVPNDLDDLSRNRDSLTTERTLVEESSSPPQLAPLALNKNNSDVNQPLESLACKFLVGNSEIQTSDVNATTPDSAITVSSLPPLLAASTNSNSESTCSNGSEKKAGKSSSEPSLETMANSFSATSPPPVSGDGSKSNASQVKIPKRANLLLYHSAKAKFSKFKNKIEKNKHKDKG